MSEKKAYDYKQKYQKLEEVAQWAKGHDTRFLSGWLYDMEQMQDRITALEAEVEKCRQALVEQRRRMGSEYDDLDAKYKKLQSNASWELNDYAKTCERLNGENRNLKEEVKTCRGVIEFWEDQSASFEAQLESSSKENSALSEKVERLEKGISAVESLINDSHGVYGLHLNGDLAPWASLRTGGQFEEWLLDFDEALKEG